MDKNKKNSAKMGLTLGVLGLLAGIILLLFSENKLIGIFGSIASAGLAFKGYKDLNE